MNPPQVIRTLLPLLLESSTESVAEISSNSLERILGPAESDEFLARVYEKLITGCYNILANHADPNRWACPRRTGAWACRSQRGVPTLASSRHPSLASGRTCVRFVFLRAYVKGGLESSFKINY